MQPEYSEQWQSPPQSQQQQQWQQAAVQRRQQQQGSQQQGAQQQSPQQPWQESVPPQWQQQQPWPQQQWQQPAAPQWQQQQVQQPWPQQPWPQQQWQQPLPQQHQTARLGRPGALWMLFGVALAIGIIESGLALNGLPNMPSAVYLVSYGDLMQPVEGLALIGFAVCILFARKAGRIGLVLVSGLALLEILIVGPYLIALVGIENLNPLAVIPLVLWVVVPVLAFLPPVNRACRR